MTSNEKFTIRPATAADASAWLQMRGELWPESFVDHQNEIAAYFGGKRTMPAEVLIAFSAMNEPLGFAELSIRHYAEGCSTENVLFLEGWYVKPAWRKHGVGTALVSAAEEWGRKQGCTEFASDSLIDNLASHQAHRALGFVEE